MMPFRACGAARKIARAQHQLARRNESGPFHFELPFYRVGHVQVWEAQMSGKWTILVFVLAVTTTLINAAIFVGQFSTPASARVSATNSSKLLEDEDFVDGLTKLVRKTVRSYCTVGKKNGIDC